MFPILFVELLRFDHPWRPNQRGTSASTSPRPALSKLPTNASSSAPARSVSHSWHSSESRRTSSCMLVAATFNSAPPSPRTPRFPSSFPLLSPRGPWGGSRHTPLQFLFFQSRHFFQETLFQPWQFFLRTSQFRILPRLFLHILHLLITLPMLCPFFPHRFTTIQQPHIIFIIFQDLHPSPSMLWALRFYARAQHFPLYS